MIFQVLLSAAVLFLLLYGLLPIHILLAGTAVFSVLAILLRQRHGHSHSHGGMLSIDYHAQRSMLNKWNASGKFLLSVACAFISIAARPVPVAIAVFLGMSLLTIAVGKTPVRYYISMLTIPVMFILLSGIAIILEISPQQLGLLDIPIGSYYISVTPSGQRAAFALIARAAGAVGSLYMLSLSTPIYQIIDVLRRLRIPAVIIELMYLIYRYLFILLEAYENMINAASSRLGYNGYRTSMKTVLNGSLNLFFISLRRASDSFTAMEARGYDGEIRFLTKKQKIHTGEAVAIVAFIACSMAVWLVCEVVI